MRNMFLSLVLLFGLSVSSYSQSPEPIGMPKTVEKVAGATIGDYRKILKEATKWSNNLTSEKYYDARYTFKDKKTGEIKKLADLPPFDRDMFYVLQADMLSKKLFTIHEKWTADLQAMKTDDEDDKENEDDKSEAKKEDVEGFVGQMLSLRKKTAERHEELVEKVFKTYPDKFTTEEKDQYIKAMRERHDKEKLIERKK